MAGRLRAWASLAGLVSVVLFVVGSMMLFDGPNGSSPAKMAAWYGSGSNRTELHVGWVLTGLGLFFFVWFVGAVREQIVVRAAAGEGGGSLLAGIVTIGGTAFAAVAMCVIGLAGGVKTMSDDTYHHQVYSGVIHAANDATYVMLVSGGAAVSAMVFAITLAIFAFGILPRWLGWFGVAAGVAALFSLFFFTMLFWLLWIAVVSVGLFLRERSPATDARPATAAS